MSDNYMTYSSWYMECNRHNFLSFETILGSFTPLTMENSEKMKKTSADIIMLHKCTKIHDQDL